MSEEPKLSYYERNKERCKENSRRYAAEHAEYVREYRQKYFQEVTKLKRHIHGRVRAPSQKQVKKPRFIGKVQKVTKQTKLFPDISTIADIYVAPPSSGLIDIKPGVFIDWNNL